MSKKLIITAVSYLNTVPFVFGLKSMGCNKHFNLSLDVPAECARKVLNDEVDIGLVPLYAVLNKPKYKLVSDFCIGAINDVRTVTLLSNGPFSAIKRIYLDNHSKTSVNLVKVLAKFYWKMDIEWIAADIEKVNIPLPQSEAMLAIGDKVFDLEHKFDNRVDLAKEWQQFTGLPMVFAVWVTSKELPVHLTDEFCKALAYGADNIPLAVESLNGLKISRDEAIQYLSSNISYILDKPKRDAITLFEHYVNLMNPKG